MKGMGTYERIHIRKIATLVKEGQILTLANERTWSLKNSRQQIEPSFYY